MNRIEPDKVIATPHPATEDAGKVRMGFPPLRATPANVADNGKVRTGYISPAFPPVRSR